jgi:coenzyme F420-0:L-glutamate ligase/coenzyme F420-1:gamma-L-glutamate ligase
VTGLTLLPVEGVPEVRTGDDLAALLLDALRPTGAELTDGDVLVVSSKVVSKALGLWALGVDHDAAVAAQTVRVVAERRAGERVTRVVQAVAGPVMAAAGVDASNTGGRDDVLLLPEDPDAEAARLRAALLSATGLQHLGVVLSDTAGRPWRAGQADFALGACGLEVLDDLRGGQDADGRPLFVTARAVADELAAAADLVKGKTEGVPAAVVRGSGWATDYAGPGARALLRHGPTDWFALGSAETVRASLGTAPGSQASLEDGIPSVAPEPVGDRLARAVAVALRGAPEAGVDVGPSTGGRAGAGSPDGAGNGEGASDLRTEVELRVSAPSGYELGVAVARLQVALWGEWLHAEAPAEVDGPEATLTVTERSQT